MPRWVPALRPNQGLCFGSCGTLQLSVGFLTILLYGAAEGGRTKLDVFSLILLLILALPEQGGGTRRPFPPQAVRGSYFEPFLPQLLLESFPVLKHQPGA